MTDIFGNETQRALLTRGAQMHQITKGDPRFNYYGRAVGLVSPEDGDVELLTSLVRLQGNTNYVRVALDQSPALQAQIEAGGLVCNTYDCWQSTGASLPSAKAIAARAVPGHITIERLTPQSDAATRAGVADCMLDCGVLPAHMAMMTGQGAPASVAFARAQNGDIVSCAASIAYLDPAHPQAGRDAFWGMLSTRSDARGHGLSLILGAQVLIDMTETHGFTSFFTGVAPGNAPSEAVCRKMGLAPGNYHSLSVADPDLLQGGRMTK